LSPSFVYAIGRIEFRPPSRAIDKEIFQVAGREQAQGTNHEVFHAVLSKKENRYLVRQLCWIMTCSGIETYILQPRDPADFELLVQAVRPRPEPGDLDLVIGLRGPVAPAELCNGLMLPTVGFDQIYPFNRESLIGSLANGASGDKDAARQGAAEVLDRILQITDNAGAANEHRALNYLAVRYARIHTHAAEQFSRNCWLTSVETRPSPVDGVRRLVDVVFSYTHRETDFTEKFSVRVDVTEEFPFLVSKLGPYYER